MSRKQKGLHISKRLLPTVVLFCVITPIKPVLGWQGQEQQIIERDLGGIDLVVLVDISASMSNQETSDPERIRWDGVKLMLDLLGPRDRILIRRFNQSCPAEFPESEAYKKIKDYLVENKFLEWEGEPDGPTKSIFDRGFARPDLSNNRENLADRIGRFNHSKDKDGAISGYLDYGNTRIVGALESISSQLTNQDSLSPDTHIVLLTDGLDDEFNNEFAVEYENASRPPKGAIDSWLRRRLPFLSGENPFRQPIPVHIVGLNFDGLEKASSTKARDLLTRLSHVTDGQFFEVADSRNLMEAFIDLTRKLRGYWVDRFEYKGNAGESVLKATRVVNGIIDLSILSYALNEAEGTPLKERIGPPERPLELTWEGVNENDLSILNGVRKERTGQDGTLYRFYHFGQSLSERLEIGESPFARFKSQVTAHMTLHGSERTQRLVLLKSTRNLFTLVSPKASETFSRHTPLQIRVDMADSRNFQPEWFEAIAHIRPVGTGQTVDGDIGGQSTAVVEYPLKPDSHGFQAIVPLSKLKQISEAGQYDYYEVNVTIKGKQTPEHALSGNSRDLPPRSFRVQNTVELKTLPQRYDLTLGNPSITIDVETSLPTEDPIPLQIEFKQPRLGNEALPLERFDVQFSNTDDQKRLVLKQGKGTVTITLNQPRLLPPKMSFNPGKLVVTNPSKVVSTERQESDIHLRIDSAKVKIAGTPVELDTGEDSGPLKVLLDPVEQPGYEDGEMTIRLEHVETSGRSGFPPQQLWLTTGDKNIALDKRTQTLDKMTLDKVFQVHFAPQGSPAPGRYKYRLIAEAKWLDTVETDVTLFLETPEIVLNHDRQEINLSPGSDATVTFNAWLRGLPDGQDRIYIKTADSEKDFRSGDEVAFRTASPDSRTQRFRIHAPDMSQRVPVITSAKDRGDGAPLTFTIGVPQEASYGRYFAQFTLSGRDVKDRTLIIQVNVNALEFEIATRGPDGKILWNKQNDERLILIVDTKMTQYLRVSTALPRSHSKESTQVALRGVFEDEGGRVQPIPEIKAQEGSLREDGQVFAVRFANATNGNETGSPFSIEITASAPELGVRQTNFRFLVHVIHHGQLLKRQVRHPK